MRGDLHLHSSAEGGSVIKEQVSATCETRNRPYLYALDPAGKRALLIRPDCKMWKCQHCAEVNRVKWVYRIKQGLDHYTETEGCKWWFATLTTHRSIKTFGQSVYVWRSAWDKLYKRMKRECIGQMHYVLLPELAPETGRLHAHMLVSYGFGATYARTDRKGKDWYDCRWIKDEPAKCGLGYMNDIRPVSNSGLGAWYVSKYVGKTLSVEKWPEHFRRVRVSNGWPEQAEMEGKIDGLEWLMIPAGKLEERIEALWRDGLDVVDIKSGEIVEGIDL